MLVNDPDAPVNVAPNRGAAPPAGYRSLEFTSDGALLRGRLYLPDRQAAGAVVMAHGFSATIPMVMDRYAECLRDHGLAVLAFDHRGHGSSDGEPRGEINAWVQALGYIEAIGAARDSTGTSRVALWSDSLSARVALGVAALDDRVSALVCQVPALGAELGADDVSGDRLAAMERFLSTGPLRGPSDGWRSAPVVSADQEASTSALKPLTAYRWFIEYGGRYGTGWTNRVTFTAAPDAPDFDPFACAPRVRVPTFFAMSPDDEMPGAVSSVTRAVFDRIPGRKEVIEVDGGHFGLLEHPSPAFEQVSRAQAQWLARTLGTPA
ncbi:MAG: alpha/beta fold hydrolase [Chloroflexi bacterium]|nr:alpha/beta fold hydrolase [Chloroflexota bacterium]